MNKKILLGLSIALVALFAIGTVSAFDLSDLGSIFGTPPDQNVTIKRQRFPAESKAYTEQKTL